MDEAEVYSKVLVESFPESKYKKQAFWSLATSSWRKQPRNYRLVADYLQKIQHLSDSNVEKNFLSLNIADCYFLSNDFKSTKESNS